MRDKEHRQERREETQTARDPERGLVAADGVWAAGGVDDDGEDVGSHECADLGLVSWCFWGRRGRGTFPIAAATP